MTIDLRPDDDPIRIELPAAGTGARTARGQLDRTRRVLLAGSAVLAVAGLVLAVVGISEVRSSTAGKRVHPTSDPSAPGFEAFVTPTPTMLVLHEQGGALSGVALLLLGAGDAGGTVVLMPPGTLGDYGGYGSYRLADQYQSAGSDGVRVGVQGLLDLSIPEVLVVDEARLARLVASTAPLEIVSPDEVATADGRVFAAGPLTLDEDDVAPYLAATREGETDLNRTGRAELVWRAWLGALRADGPDATPGERDAGIGRFLGVLAAGSAVVQALPLDEAEGAPPEAPAFAAQPDAVAAFVASSVPLPAGHTPGNRARVRLLNGTTDASAIGRAAQVLVRELAEITVLGNAERFGLRRSEVAYTDAKFEEIAERFGTALGGAKVVREKRSPAAADVIDITVRIGQDFTEGSSAGGG